MKQVLIDFIGEYDVQAGDGFGSVDWAWVLAAILVICFIVCLIKFLGGLLRVK